MKPSLLLIDAVLASLANLEPGKGHTARSLAREVGEDQARVLRELSRLREAGALKGRTIRPRSRPNEKPYLMFTPVGNEVEKLINARKN